MDSLFNLPPIEQQKRLIGSGVEHFAYRTEFAPDLYTRDHEHWAEHVQWSLQSAQINIGKNIVPRIMQLGGTALVNINLEMHEEFSYGYPHKTMIARADLKPSSIDYVPMRVEVAHMVYFPADWVCVKCGSLLDGLKHPRECYHCGAPRRL